MNKPYKKKRLQMLKELELLEVYMSRIPSERCEGIDGKDFEKEIVQAEMDGSQRSIEDIITNLDGMW